MHAIEETDGCKQPAHREEERLAELHSYHILDTAPETGFDDFTKLASFICGTPISLISLVNAERQWFKSRLGLAISETPRSLAFCNYTIQGRDVLEISDTWKDVRFVDHPLVVADPSIRFYAGAPLATPSGHNIGTLCVIDRVPRTLNAEQKAALLMLSRQVMERLNSRRDNFMISRQAAFYEAILSSAGAGIISASPKGVITHFNPSAERMLGYGADEMIGIQTPEIWHDRKEMEARARELSQELGHPIEPGFDVFVTKAKEQKDFVDTREWTYIRRDGSKFPVLLSVSAIRDASGNLVGFMGVVRDISEIKKLEQDLVLQAITIKRQSDLLSEIRIIQDRFISDQTGKGSFDHLLQTLLAVTKSEYGLIGELQKDSAGRYKLEVQACAHVKARDNGMFLEEGNIDPASLEYRGLQTIADEVIATSPPLMRRGKGGAASNGVEYPRNFVVIPVFSGDDLVGIAGAANSPADYSDALLEENQLLATTYSNIILARRNIESRRVAEQRLQEQEVLLRQKQNLLQEVHHRVKNNLQVISSLLNLQQGQTASAEVLLQLKTARSRIAAVALLHEVLYRSDSMEKIELPQFLSELAKRLKGAFSDSMANITLEVQAPEAINLSPEQAGPLALIINELATNAIKHAFVGRQGGRLQIIASSTLPPQKDQRAELQVDVLDNGVGYGLSADAPVPTGLGMKIAQRLTAQLGGELNREPSQEGTVWRVKLPL